MSPSLLRRAEAFFRARPRAPFDRERWRKRLSFDPDQDLQYGSFWKDAGPSPRDRALSDFFDRRSRRRLSNEELWIGALAHLFAGRVAKARSRVRNSFDAKGDSVETALVRACIAAFQARRNRSNSGLLQAVDEFSAVLALDPGNLLARSWRAEIYHDLEDYRSALADLEVLLKRDPGYLWARCERAEILAEIGEEDRSRAELDRLVRGNPEKPWAWSLRGRQRVLAGDVEGGLGDLKKASRLDPSNASVLVWEAEGLRVQGDLEGAETLFSNALKLSKGAVLARLFRAKTRLMLGRGREALRDLNRVCREDSRYRLAFSWRAQALIQNGRFAEAAREITRLDIGLDRAWIVPLSAKKDGLNRETHWRSVLAPGLRRGDAEAKNVLRLLSSGERGGKRIEAVVSMTRFGERRLRGGR